MAEQIKAEVMRMLWLIIISLLTLLHDTVVLLLLGRRLETLPGELTAEEVLLLQLISV